jgi:hypothetical protein
VSVAHPAQPSASSADVAQATLDNNVAILIAVRDMFYQKTSKKLREQVSRELAGVIADLETLRLALR